MELGSWAIVQSFPLLALIPLFIYIVLALREKDNVWATMLGITAGVFLCGMNLKGIATLFAGVMSSSTVFIGVIIMMGAGLGRVMTEARVTHTMVYWIVKRVGVKTQNRARLALVLCTMLVCGMLGSLFAGTSVIAPIVIPVMASLGLTPSAVGVLFKIAGEIGLILGPLTGVTLITLEVTGMSYTELLLGAALPFSIFFMGGAWLGSLWVQKKTEGKESYVVSEGMQNLDEIVISKQEAITTFAFLATFLSLVVYGIITKQGTSYALIVMILLITVVALVARLKVDAVMDATVKGVQSQAKMFIIFVTIEVLLQMVTAGGGFDALGGLLSSVASDNPTALMLIASIVGGLGIEGAAVAEIRIIAEMFIGAARDTGLPISMFAIAILCSTRLTGNIYPSINFIGMMGLSGCTQIKDMLRGCWISVAVVWVAVLIWAFAGVAILT